MRQPRRTRLPAGLVLAVLGALPPAAGAGPARAHATVTLTPAAADGDGHVPFLEVSVVINRATWPAGAAVLRLPLVTSNVQTSAGAIEHIEASRVSRAAGPVAGGETGHRPLPLVVRDDPATSPMPYRHWITPRRLVGQIRYDYRVPVTNQPNPRGAAPPFEVRSDEGAVSGLGDAFLVLPESEEPIALTVHFDLSRSGSGAVGLSGFGAGDVTLDAADAVHRAGSAFYMAGQVHRFFDEVGSGFEAAWQGSPPFDANALMAWTATLYKSYRAFFHATGTGHYGVFLRPNPINAGGGVELSGSFVGTFGPATRVEPFKLTLAHEMAHTFIGALSGDDELAGSWYAEGLAVFYQRVLPFRAHLLSAEAFLADLNSTAGRYYTDALNRTPNAEVPARFWTDTRIRVLPYDRGALYFATVDTEVRRSTHGARSLDDLVLAMLARKTSGRPMDVAAWRAVVSEALGEAGVRAFDGMLAGELVLPADDAFGPCFERTTAPLRRYELGFEPRSLTTQPRIVRGLIPGSAAALAGLREGDLILRPVPQDNVQADQAATLTLEVARSAEHLTVTYLPRGEAVDAYQWRRKENVPEASCQL